VKQWVRYFELLRQPGAAEATAAIPAKPFDVHQVLSLIEQHLAGRQP
jgi:hypothetical protein